MTEPTNSDERTWALAAHLLGAAGYFGAILSWLGPLVVWLAKREQSRFVAFHALQELFFQLAWIVILAVGWGITALLSLVIVGLALIPVMIALHFVPIIWPIVAAIKANNGEWYQYPVVGEWARRNVGV